MTLFKTLENIDPSNNEHRMHCLNVLRAMFRHSRLGEIVASYIGAGVIVAIKNFTSEDWGVSITRFKRFDDFNHKTLF